MQLAMMTIKKMIYNSLNHWYDKGRGRISNGKWAPKDSLAILPRKVRGAFLKQIQVKLCILKLLLKRKYCKMLYRSGTWFSCIPSNIIFIHLNFFSCEPLSLIYRSIERRKGYKLVYNSLSFELVPVSKIFENCSRYTKKVTIHLT